MLCLPHMLPAAGSNRAAAAWLDFPAAEAYAAAMSSDARSKARQYYEGSGRSLGADMAALAANPQGVVVFLPHLVVLMKPVESACPEQWQALACSPLGADAWYVHLLVGDLAWARRIGRGLPAYAWLCFQRGTRSSALHRVDWARFVASKSEVPTKKEPITMGFKKMLGASTPPTTSSQPPTVTETQQNDARSDYEQRTSLKRGLLSTILSNRNRVAAMGGNYGGGNKTLG